MEASRRLIPRFEGSARTLLVPALLIAYTIGIFQARTVYLQVIALVMLFAWYRRAVFGKMNLAYPVNTDTYNI